MPAWSTISVLPSLSLWLSSFIGRRSRSPVLILSFSSSSRRTCSLEGSELADGHYGGYSAGFSRLSKAHKRVCPPEGQGTPSGTGSPPSPPLFTSLPPLARSLILRLSFSPTPLTSSHLAAAQPALCPLRCSYLRVLLIFSYYRRWACRHVSLTHPPVQPVRTRATVHLEVQRVPPLGFPLYAVPYAPLSPTGCLTAPLGAPQVLQYVSTLLQRHKGNGREAKLSGSLARERRRGETHTRSPRG